MAAEGDYVFFPGDLDERARPLTAFEREWTEHNQRALALQRMYSSNGEHARALGEAALAARELEHTRIMAIWRMAWARHAEWLPAKPGEGEDESMSA